MKKIVLLSLLCLASLSAMCQDTLRIYYDNNWKETTQDKSAFLRKKIKDGALWKVIDYYKSGKIQMRGSYRDDSCKIQQGEFIFYDQEGERSQLANYNAGELDGKIIFYNKGGLKVQEGFYTMGKYDGDWIGYDESGKISGKAHFENDKQISSEFYNEDGTKNNTVHEFFRESTFPGGPKALSQYLSTELKYPKKAVKNNIEGTVLLQFIVDEKGKVTDITILKSVEESLDEEALRVVKKMPDWKPAIWGGKLSKSYKKLPIVFKLQGK